MTKMVKSRINDLEIENAELHRQIHQQHPTLRDRFAMAAIPRLHFFKDGGSDLDAVAKYVYELADAMMEARNDRHV